MSLSSYVRRRNGVRLGGRGSLTNMLARAFGAGSLRGFWSHWNPIWGYGLARFVFSPLRRALPASLSLVLTFLVSGLIHDAVIMLVRWEIAFLFGPWFLLIGIGILVSERQGWTFGRRPWLQRATVHLLFAGLTLALSLALTEWLGLWWPAGAVFG